MNYILTESQIDRLKLDVSIVKEGEFDDDFMKPIGKGGDHEVFSIDSDWLLKMPHKNWMRLPTRIIAEKFDKYIKFMKQYPDIFIQIKKLSKLRAAVEKADIDKAGEEIEYVYHLMMTHKDLHDEMLERHKPYRLIEDLYSCNRPEIVQIFKNLIKYGKKNNDEVVTKWCNFIIKLKKAFGNKDLDIHSGNIGIDKNGNIKLVDY